LPFTLYQILPKFLNAIYLITADYILMQFLLSYADIYYVKFFLSTSAPHYLRLRRRVFYLTKLPVVNITQRR